MSEPLHPASDDRGDQGRKTPARSPTNEARRFAPGSRERRGFSVRGSVDASMRPGAKRRDQPFGQQYLAPDCGLASMRPGAKRRDHGGAAVTSIAGHYASMRPDAKRQDHRRRSPGWRIRLRCLNEARREAPGSRELPGSPMGTRGTSFNEARREAPGSRELPGSPMGTRGTSFNEARREAPGSRLTFI